ncbi:UDP-glycosyltransferase CGT-like [Wolffia australiana]
MAPVMSEGEAPHLALLPSAGMGHLTPFLRLAAMLASGGAAITFICPTPVVSAAEAAQIDDLVSSSPSFRRLEFPLPPFDVSTAASKDPFFLQFESIRRAASLLAPILSSVSPPPSALILDVTLTSAVVPVARAISLPVYIMFTSSVWMLSLCLSFPRTASRDGAIEVPGLAETLPSIALPQALRDPKNLFTIQFCENGKAMADADGIIVNTWEALEPATLAALNAGKVVPGLPPVIPVGPLHPSEKSGPSALPWLDAQPDSSVIYVSFGSRTALPPDQIRELAAGLENSGCGFLWVLKTKKVDKEEGEDGERAMNEFLGEDFLERMEGRGKVVKGWVNQQAVLRHPAVGGFLSHCGWNSVTEAAVSGVRVLAWPRHGDQRINAMVVEKSGLGEWPKEWSWDGDDETVRGEEISRRIGAFMVGSAAAAAKVKEQANGAASDGGSSHRHLEHLVAKFKIRRH